MRFLWILLWSAALMVCTSVYSQDSLKSGNPNTNSGIELFAFIEPQKIPQNRTAILTIRLQWYGNLDRYDVHSFDTPVVQNFEIIGSGSANRIEAQAGQQTAIKDYTFKLKPKAMGMGYVEGLIITYTDRVTDTQHKLITNRIKAEVVEPVAERDSQSRIGWALLVFLVSIGAAFLLIILRKKKLQKQIQAEETAALPLEEEYLKELKKTVDFNDAVLNVSKVFTDLSRLLRGFLKEKYHVPALEATTNEVVQDLEDKNVEQRFINDIKEILSTADVIKFSGGSVSRSDVEQTYTRIESILEKSLHGRINTEQKQKENESTE